ncbi:recombinase family protein [Nocardia sp. NPDC059239]|uniref:recombinase family protein n=1 Tax=Nocardia sp. NPDC059239 TaxID=3346785 RepID=UPI0036AEF36C
MTRSKATTGRIPADIFSGADVRVGTYTRRSTDDEHQPYSIDAQDTRLESYIDSQPGWRHVASYSDDASGASVERPDLQRALAAAKAGAFDVLLVYRVDRFSRNLRDLVTLLDDLDRVGVVFRSATEPFDTSTPMGRMHVQMLGMFAQFERDTIIDRVTAGMERKAAQGKWKGGKRPYGYRVDKTTHTLVIDDTEAVVVRMIFDLYTRKRLGARAVAAELNARGHRASTGREWTGHHVLRILPNRTYLGELTFRDVTVTDTHPALIDTATFDHAQTVLDARGESHAHRAANSSDYLLTGRLRCPRCGRAMVGTRATGRHRTYRYYTCFTRARYDSDKCNFTRLDADAVDTALLEALAKFYRTRHNLIDAAITAAQQRHHDTSSDTRAELATVTAELAKTQQSVDRYLAAFENGTLEPELVGGRLTELRSKTTQLLARRDQLTESLASVPSAPAPATLDRIADHIVEIVTSGNHTQSKALIETLVAHVKIAGPDAESGFGARFVPAP